MKTALIGLVAIVLSLCIVLGITEATCYMACAEIECYRQSDVDYKVTSGGPAYYNQFWVEGVGNNQGFKNVQVRETPVSVVCIGQSPEKGTCQGTPDGDPIPKTFGSSCGS